MRWIAAPASRLICLILVLAVVLPASIPQVMGQSATPVAAGDPSDPVPLGAEAAIGGGWYVAVPAAARDVTAGMPGATPPPVTVPSGLRSVLIRVRVVYRDPAPAPVAYHDVLLAAEAQYNDSYWTYDNLGALACLNVGGVPDLLDLPDTPVPVGDVIEGNLCFEVAVEDVPILQLRAVGPDLQTSAVYFALHESDRAATPTD